MQKKTSPASLAIGSGYSPNPPHIIPPYENNNDPQPPGAVVVPPPLPAASVDEEDKKILVIKRIPLRRFVTAYLFIFFHSGFLYYWRAWPLANTIFVNGIVQLGTSAEWVSARYGWDWWCVWLLGLNTLLPLTLAWAVTNNRIEEWTRLHGWIARMSIYVNLAVFIILTVRWPLFHNTPFSGGSPGNHDGWCCYFFPSPWCPNNSVCSPDVSLGDLVRSDPMTQHWAFSLVFFLLGVWNRDVNTDFRDFRVLN